MQTLHKGGIISRQVQGSNMSKLSLSLLPLSFSYSYKHLHTNITFWFPRFNLYLSWLVSSSFVLSFLCLSLSTQVPTLQGYLDSVTTLPSWSRVSDLRIFSDQPSTYDVISKTLIRSIIFLVVIWYPYHPLHPSWLGPSLSEPTTHV